ncbi:bactericidal permeability-increasing protein-like isoform 1-T1 [Tautogolabrus adspersus]
MFLRCLLALLALTSLSFSTNPGVQVRLTKKGLEYGRQLGMASIQQKLNTITIPDISGKVKLRPVGKVQYSLSNMRVRSVGLPQSELSLVPGTGFRLGIRNAFLSMNGNWRVKFHRILKIHGSFDLNVKGLTITTSIALKSDKTGRPDVSTVSCAATVGSASIKFHGGGSWLYNLFRKFIDKALRKALEKKLCPLVADAVSDLNPTLKTLNVLAKVDKFAEIEYSMVSSPTVSTSSLDLGLKGEFYNIGKHQEPPFLPPKFALPPKVNEMLYIGVSPFTVNSAAFVYNKAGVLSMNITDDMIPQSSPIRLDTNTFGALIPQIAERFPGLKMKLLVNAPKDPVISFEPNNASVQATAAMTAYAIQPNATLTPLFVLNLDISVSARVFVSGMKIAGAITLNKMDLTLGTSYVGEFQVGSLDDILKIVLKLVVIPQLNTHLAKGYPLPTLGKMKLVNTQLQVLQDYMLIGTDIQFTR